MAHLRIPHEGLLVIGIILVLFVLAMLCLAGAMNPRELLDCSLFRCCWRRREEDDDELIHTYPTINEFIFEADTPETAGFVAMNDMEDGQVTTTTTTTMNHVFPDLLAQDDQSSSNEINQPLL